MAAGALSDMLSAQYGSEGLRYSLIAMTSLLLVSSWLLYGFGRALSADHED